jgi:serine/threonine protein kinase
VKREDIKLIKLLGEGATGYVYKALRKGVDVAAKKLKVLGKDGDPKGYRALVMEIDVLCAVGKHPNLVALCGVCMDDQDHPIILEEFVTGPNIDQFFEDRW